MANSKASWNDISKEIEYITQSPSPRSSRQTGESVYTTTTSTTRSSSPVRTTHYEYEDDGGYVETSRSGVVSPSNVNMKTRTSRVVNKVINANRFARSSSPERHIIREIHHYDDSAAKTNVEETHHYESSGGRQEAVNESVREVRHYQKAKPQPIVEKRIEEIHEYAEPKPAPVKEKIREIHHYINDEAPAASTKTVVTREAREEVARPAKSTMKEVVREVHQYDQTPRMREVVHQYDQTPRPTHNIQKTTQVVKQTRVASPPPPPPAAHITREVRTETNVMKNNKRMNDASNVHRETRVVRNITNGGSNLKKTNVSTTVVNEKVHNKGVYKDKSSKRRFGCCGKKKNNSSHYSSSTYKSDNRVDAYNSSASTRTTNRTYLSDYTGSGYTGASVGADVGRRKCCALLMGILGLLLLAGLITGLYFGIKAAMDKSSSSTSSAEYQYNQGYYNSGYYVNGVYVIPVTLYDNRVYLIYGDDVPCNKFNNNTDTTDIYPDCVSLTTNIQTANWTTTVNPVTIVPVALAGTGGGSHAQLTPYMYPISMILAAKMVKVI